MSRPARWFIAVDTGGTFTDARASTPEGKPRRAKILSSSRLRARIVDSKEDASGRTSVTIDRDFDLPDAFFVDFHALSGSAARKVTGWERAGRTLFLDGGDGFGAGSIIDLTTGEEVPVLAARVLTQTPLGHPLPPLDLRLATTRGTNALLENNGEPPHLFLPVGFTDLLEIGDQRRPDLFALEHHKRVLPLASSRPVAGRLDADGEVITPLDLGQLESEIGSIERSRRRCAAVALLHSHRNPAHEQAVERQLRDAGFRHVTISSACTSSMRLLPRAQTAVTDAYLSPVMASFVDSVSSAIGGDAELLLMSSAGGLQRAAEFRPKDSLLSGPAGGLVGAAAAAQASGIAGDLITFDMGGTSTDVARVGEGRMPYQFEHRVGAATVMAPALKIETVAAGGGSICALRPEGLSVGPESAGAEPGPACYGRGGPLTVTDVNLLLGRIDPGTAGIPLDPEASRRALQDLKREMAAAEIDVPADHELLLGLLAIAVERMAEAVRTISFREGYDPAKHTLVAFGGAGPGHACALADSLGISRILVPSDAGLLSASGVFSARLERFAEQTLLEPLESVLPTLDRRVRQLDEQAIAKLGSAGEVVRRIAELRLVGQEQALEIEVEPGRSPGAAFAERFESLFGYPPPEGRTVELVSLRVAAATAPVTPARLRFEGGTVADAPHVESSPFFTLHVDPGWKISRAEDGSVLLERVRTDLSPSAEHGALAADIARGRLSSIVENMGAVLKRCAISTNIREREDYSCAILDASGRLAINAPHIPVHLGAMGLCVREVCSELPLRPGDIAITNHPARGGSHLPDITVIAAAFDRAGDRIAYLANRAHHAEIGGIAPGSMPPDACSLAHEGVVIAPQLLFEEGVARIDRIANLLRDAPYPTRNLPDNLADLSAQAAALRGAVAAVEALDADLVRRALAGLLDRSSRLCSARIATLQFEGRDAVERLDNGAEIRVALRRDGGRLGIDFSGTSGTLEENLNATPAIVRSAVLYVLRLLLKEDLPLNEGLLSPVDITLPNSLLNPDFPPDPAHCPPVVGGNVETSQRLVDTLVKALALQAGSQGTMNNLLFGNDSFGYYETIAGGAGAGPGYPGASALHTHMTNTAITDPEVIEWRYPVRLREFSIRRGSGGAGRYPGGDGVRREFEFLEPLTLSILAEHRKERPSGLEGGGDGAPGGQSWTGPDSNVHPLPGRFTGDLPAGSIVRIETPGGGGYGSPESG